MADIELVIKIPKKLFCEGFERPFTEEEKNILIKAVGNGTPIPGNATNGDMIKAMFPEINKYFSNVIEWRLWWNAPYQKGDKE